MNKEQPSKNKTHARTGDSFTAMIVKLLVIPGALAALTYWVGVEYFAWHWAYALCAASTVAYLPSFLDGSETTADGRMWPWFANHPRTKAFMSATPYKLIRDGDITPGKQYIFGIHPHGIGSFQHGMMMADVGAPNGFGSICPPESRRDLGASVVFRIPGYRELLLWLGCVDASRSTANKVLKSGKSLVILIGGEAEQLLSQRGEHTIVIKGRKGFVRLALQHGIPIVPAYCFGETDLYSQSSFLFDIRKKIQKKLGICLTLSWGRNPLLPFLPHNDVELVQVFGNPIAVTKTEQPTQADIDAVHEAYIKELQRIFNKYKKQLGYEDKELSIV